MFGWKRNLIEQSLVDCVKRLETLELVIQAQSMEVVFDSYAPRDGKPIVVTLEGKRTVVANGASQFGFLYTQLKNAISQEAGKKE